LSDPSPRHRGYPVSPAGVPASRPPRGGPEREQGFGASSQGQFGFAGTWAREMASRPARSQVPPISGGE
jgi:hypothetical protein